jgi:mono/diheme cytochrome c family protein
MRAPVLLATLLLAGAASGQPLEPYLPPGMERAPFERALDDDLGSGLSGSIPSAVLYAVLELEPERFGADLDDAYRRFGFLFVAGRSLPVGITEVRRLGVRAHQFNCLACHAGQGRAPGEEGLLVVGANNADLRFGAWFEHVFGALRALAGREWEALGSGPPPRSGRLRLELDARIGARLVDAACRGLRRAGRRLSVPEAGVLAVMARASVDALLEHGPAPKPDRYGPGRTVVQQAYRRLRFGLAPGPFAPIKPPDLFGVRHRETLLWTGNETYPEGTPPAERIARNGMLVPWIQLNPVTERPIPDALTLMRAHRYLRMGELLAQAAPPPAPAPDEPSDWEALRRGQRVFRNRCVRCHGDYRLEPAPTPSGRAGLLAVPQGYPERILPLADVGTDPAYAQSNDEDFLEAFEGSLLGRAGLFDGRVTGGYVARPLLGLRLRAPFLHNGSVPSLRWLLTPPGERPQAFWVGPGVPYDPGAVGLAHPLSAPPPNATLRRADAAGDRALGHPFGTDLPPADKADLLEFLRRL